VCDLETSRMGAPYIYDISHLRVNYHRYGLAFTSTFTTVHIALRVGVRSMIR